MFGGFAFQVGGDVFDDAGAGLASALEFALATRTNRQRVIGVRIDRFGDGASLAGVPRLAANLAGAARRGGLRNVGNVEGGVCGPGRCEVASPAMANES